VSSTYYLRSFYPKILAARVWLDEDVEVEMKSWFPEVEWIDVNMTYGIRIKFEGVDGFFMEGDWILMYAHGVYDRRSSLWNPMHEDGYEIQEIPERYGGSETNREETPEDAPLEAGP
jgi:hypothetical protein